MGTVRSDSAEVVRFMALFEKIKCWTDDLPGTLAAVSVNDSSVKDLCIGLFFAADLLKTSELSAKAAFIAPVKPVFLAAWRDYEDRYESIVSDIWWSDVLGEVIGANASRTAKPDSDWVRADEEASNQSDVIESALGFALDNADQDHRWGEEQEEFIQGIKDGLVAWNDLKETTGFDLRGVFRRRKLYPKILVPGPVAAKYGSAGHGPSMLRNLDHAHDAFIHGATYGALALMRSILEAVLREHYRAQGRDLNECIENARGRLPPKVHPAALHRLRTLANRILHLDPGRQEILPEMDGIALEKEIVRLLHVLRALIEGAK